jgi:hypothetical protein
MRLSLQIAVAVLVAVLATPRHVIAQYYGQFEQGEQECASNGGIYDEING